MEASAQNDKKDQGIPVPDATAGGGKEPRKKPKSSILKRLVKWIVIPVFCLAILWTLVAVIWNWSSSEKLNKKLDELRRRGEPLSAHDIQEHYEKLLSGIERNGAHLYLAAFEAIKNDRNNKEWESLPVIDGKVPPPGAKLSPETDGKVQDFLEKHKWFFEVVELAQQCKGCMFPRQYTDGAEMCLPELASIRSAVRIVLLKCYWAACRDDFDTAVGAIEAAFRLAKDLDDDWTLIARLVQVAVTHVSISQLEHLLSAGAISADQLARLERVVPEGLDMDSYTMSLIAERGAMGLWAFDEVLGGNATVNSLCGNGETEFSSCLWWIVPSGLLKDQCIRYLDFMTTMIDFTKLPPTEARARIHKDFQVFVEERRQGGAIAAVENFVLDLLLPALHSCYDKYVAGSQRLALARAAVTLERFRAEKGSLPETLDELVPAFMDKVPEDHFAQGKIRFLKDAKGYTVWSVGCDGVDNKGARDTSNNDGRDGFDIVVRIER
ncbi:MAG: hypothetical protein RDV41_09325 [Planctomycetota bacterium]|nr:hypothetical protein [Planctomycetota bacterium]